MLALSPPPPPPLLLLLSLFSSRPPFPPIFSPSIPRSEVPTMGAILCCFLPTRAAARFACGRLLAMGGGTSASSMMGRERENEKKKKTPLWQEEGEAKKERKSVRTFLGPHACTACSPVSARERCKFPSCGKGYEERERKGSRSVLNAKPRIFCVRSAGKRKVVRRRLASIFSFFPRPLATSRLRSLSSSLSSTRFKTMADAAALKAAAEAAEAAVTQQGDAVRALKASLKQGEATKVRRGREGRALGRWCSAAAAAAAFRSIDGLFFL